MKKTIIAKISEGLGNQLFMYSHAYALSKKFDLEFFIDPTVVTLKKMCTNTCSIISTYLQKLLLQNGYIQVTIAI